MQLNTCPFEQQRLLLHSLKLTAKAPENRPGPKRKRALVVQPSIFRGKLAVSFREIRSLMILFGQLSQPPTKTGWLQTSFVDGRVFLKPKNGEKG